MTKINKDLLKNLSIISDEYNDLTLKDISIVCRDPGKTGIFLFTN
jgi:hypothetical protein